MFSALIFFAGAQLALDGLQRWQPIYRDPIFGHKLKLLRHELATNPGAPLVLFQGSSRVMFGVRPDVLRASCTTSGQVPTVLNLSEPGTGPTFDLVYLHRLLSRGIRPDFLFVEVWTGVMGSGAQQADIKQLRDQPLEWSDLRLLRRYSDSSANDWWNWLQPQLAPWYWYRLRLQQMLARAWLVPSSPPPLTLQVDEYGWHAAPVVAPGQREQWKMDYYRKYYEPGLRFGQFTPSPHADRALREICALCNQRHIQVVLLFMPEESEFRSWYAPTFRSALESYLDGVSRDCAVPWIDARDWVPDDHFLDSLHLASTGATLLSKRLAREVLQPLLDGRHATQSPAVPLVREPSRSTPSPPRP